MKKTKFKPRQMSVVVILISCIILIQGCTVPGPSDPSVIALNKTTLSGKGEYIGTLPDGRNITRYEISRGNSDTHWIYVVNKTETITENHHQGKYNNHVIVVIDGVEYTPKIESN